MRVGARRQRLVLELGAEILRMPVADHGARIALALQEAPHELVHADLLRAADLDRAVDRRRLSEAGHQRRDVVGSDRLHLPDRQADGLPLGRRLGDAADEFEELGRAQDRIGNPRLLDQLLLHDLGAEIAAVGQALGADDGEGDMVADAGGGLRGEQVAAGGPEERHDVVVCEGRRVRHVDDHLRAVQRSGQPFSGDGVDAGVGRGGQHLMSLLLQARYDIGTDQAGPADDNYVHDFPPSVLVA